MVRARDGLQEESLDGSSQSQGNKMSKMWRNLEAIVELRKVWRDFRRLLLSSL